MQEVVGSNQGAASGDGIICEYLSYLRFRLQFGCLRYVMLCLVVDLLSVLLVISAVLLVVIVIVLCSCLSTM